jgi:hypothetical protein
MSPVMAVDRFVILISFAADFSAAFGFGMTRLKRRAEFHGRAVLGWEWRTQ